MSYPGYQRFSWRGAPIPDITIWAKEHNEPMVDYHAERTVVNPWWDPSTDTTLAFIKEEHDGQMPAIFFDNLAMTDGWMYRERKRKAL